MKLGSLFDGSGGFPLAGALCGITPVFASEIEPYPIAVTTSRFPNMRHYGDVSKVNGAEIEPVDILTFGSPCQDLSVAGKRAGLKHTENGDEETTRSGLFMEAVRIIKEMRKATNGLYPTFVLWENVPGAFSSNGGDDFRIVLEELIKIVEPSATVPAPDKGGWPYADAYVGDGWSLAYRTLDAQYWGVPQRRRRIYLVADFRGERAAEILFEREGLRGNSPQSGTPRQGTAADAERSAGADDREGKIAGIIDSIGGQAERGWEGETAPCLKASHYKFPPSIALFQPKSLREENWSECDVKNALRAGESKSSHALVECYDARGNGNGKTASTITGDHENRITDYTTVLVEGEGEKPVYCLQGNGIDRADTAGCNGKGWREDQSYTLNTIDRPAVAYSFQGFGAYKESEQGSSLKARDYKDATDLVCETAGVDCRNATEYPEMNGTLQAKPNGGFSYNCNQVVRHRYIVRRLTPTECARLQGFPDLWGHPDHKETLTDEEYRFWLDVRNTHAAINGKQVKEYTREQILKWYNGLHTDSSEYKMWGNGIALPTALYVMQGIAEKLKEKE